MNVQAQPDNLAAKRSLPFEVVALVLQGGGALGAYQAGVYEALSEAGISGRRSPRMDHGRARAMHVSAWRRVTPCAS
jgi:hypothetical protein